MFLLFIFDSLEALMLRLFKQIFTDNGLDHTIIYALSTDYTALSPVLLIILVGHELASSYSL